MKQAVRTMCLALAFGIIAALGLTAFIRLAPVDPANWQVELANPRPEGLPIDPSPVAGDPVVTLRNGAYADLTASPEDAHTLLARLDAVALATPRTLRIAGSVAEGHITWETRSLVWGFPDYTTAQVTGQGLTLYARLRFGGYDFGVNAARLRGWLRAL